MKATTSLDPTLTGCAALAAWNAGVSAYPPPASVGRGAPTTLPRDIKAVGIADDKGGLPWNESPPSVAGPVYGPTEETLMAEATEVKHDWRWYKADPTTVYFFEEAVGLPEQPPMLHGANHITLTGSHAVANARLIAQAPALFSCLIAYHVDLHGCTTADCTVEGCEAKEVIQKVRGAQ